MKLTFKSSFGITVLSPLLLCVLPALLAGCTTLQPSAAEQQRLQGTWEGILVGQEKDGKISLTINGNSLHFHRDTNFWFETTFTIPTGVNPNQLRTTIKNTPDKDSIGKVVRPIFKIGDGNLTLAINQDPAQEPPRGFDDETPGIIHYEFWRVQSPKKKIQASTSGETNQVQPITGNK